MTQPDPLPVWVLIDLGELVEQLGGAEAAGPALDWGAFPEWLAVDAASAALSFPAERLRFAGAVNYVPDDHPTGPGAADLSHVLARLAQTSEVRRVQAGPEVLGECRACDLAGTARCHRCRNTSSPAGRFGGAVGNAMAADLFRLVREGAFAVAVVLSADRGLMPALRFVKGRGKLVVHAAFPPKGRDLSEASSGMVDLSVLRA